MEEVRGARSLTEDSDISWSILEADNQRGLFFMPFC